MTRPDIAVVSARHEGAAANMAEADGKLTARPGICFVTRGPGAMHASIGVHTAFQDSTPMVLFIGQVARDARDREGFQEVDFRAMFAPVAKWAAEIDSTARIPEYVARAFRTAMSGRAGPVVLSLPEDMLSEVIARRRWRRQQRLRAPRRALPTWRPSPRCWPRRSALARDRRQRLDFRSCRALLNCARENELPIVASFRRQDLIDNRDPNYCGHLGLGVDPKLAECVRSADLIVAMARASGKTRPTAIRC